MTCPKGCVPGWMNSFPYTKCYGCEFVESDEVGFIIGCKATKKDELDSVQQCRNCVHWDNEICRGHCMLLGKNTIAKNFCEDFKKGKKWSQRNNPKDDGREPLNNMPFIDERRLPDI